MAKRRHLHIDIVDYPGEWLLDLALLGKSFCKWSEESLDLARRDNRAGIASDWLSFLDEIDLGAEMDEERVIEGAGLFRDYLRAARSEPYACSALPPGRFLMPGDLEGSPMLTFFPLPPAPTGAEGNHVSPLHKMMKRRYKSYLSHIVTPFYRDHFSRLDRQIVLVDLARRDNRAGIASGWLSFLDEIDLGAEMDEERVIEGAGLFRDYLRAARSEPYACSALPPGRFLMPGDLEGSPMLTFFPLPPAPTGAEGNHVSPLHKMMKRRYKSYLSHIVTPFYRDHFSRLDRQIVLVDALGALNAGPSALQDLEQALSSILGSFRAGKNNILSSIFRPRIDRILFAATKADHVHHSDHDKLADLLRFMTDRAIRRAEYKGADVKVMAMAAIRATVEGVRGDGASALPILTGVPLEGERLGDKIFDGREKAAIFPGDLPGDPSLALAQGRKDADGKTEMDMRFIRFRPPAMDVSAGKSAALFPHIRLDHALDFLIGDKI